MDMTTARAPRCVRSADGTIRYNWCMIDVLDVLRQGGVCVLPPAPPTGLIDDGLYPPPRAVDGLPAPNSVYVGSALAARRAEMEAAVMAAISADLVQMDGRALSWAEDAAWYGPGGIGRATNRAQYAEHFLEPLAAAFEAPASLALDMVLCEANYCGAHFLLRAKHVGAWLGVAATGRVMTLRFGMHVRLAVSTTERRSCADPSAVCIAEAWAQVDLLAAFASVGVDLLANAKKRMVR